MARQLQQLPASQRQSFAAASNAIHTESAQATEQAALLANKDRASQAQNQDKTAPKDNARVSKEAPGHNKEDKQESSAKSSSGSSHRSLKASTDYQDNDLAPATPWQGDLPHALALAASAANSVANALTDPADGIPAARTAANLAAQELANASDAATNKLQMYALSPKVHIITDPRQAPSPESLTAFAKSMGLDEATIQNLMGPASQASTPGANGLPSSSANGMPNGIANNAGFNISALLGAALNGGSDTANITQADAAFNQAMTQALSTSTQSPAANANLLQSAAAAPLNFGISGLPVNGLSQAEMASIQHIQMTVLPPAVFPVQSGNIAQAFNTPSTASVLSLLGGNLQEQDITSLASSFSQNMGEQSDTSGSDSSGQSSSGFAQALAQSNASDNRSVANKEVATVATPLNEVYDQLSDKLATEMAARMHKQLSDGQWKMKFGLRPAHLGGVEIQLEMKDGKLDAVFRAENAMTRDLLQNSTQRLRDALQNFGINAGFVEVGQNGSQNQQNASGNSTPQPQVRDNSSVGSNNSDTTAQVVANRGKDSSSLLDLYA
jgi:flagellar hook-length control protein FliK